MSFWDWFADVHIGEEWIEEGGRLGEIHGQPLFDPLPEERISGVGDGVDRVRDLVKDGEINVAKNVVCPRCRRRNSTHSTNAGSFLLQAP